jgi:hypothetical protein
MTAQWTIEPRCGKHAGKVIYLVTPEEFAKLPKGTPLLSINGREVVKGIHYVDGDTRGGYLAYGVLIPGDVK